ncbi:MAG: hypothetical protein K0V04_15600 [Deltaproteobacteria bacterium]|nr:hypothetical protein [Deltaproteobacteria bacterium]
MGLLLFILVPFALFGPALEGWMSDAMSSASSPTAVMVWTSGLLTADVVLPVPSSAVAGIAAHRLGVVASFSSIWSGMTAGCAVGLLLGRMAGKAGLERSTGPQTRSWMRRLNTRLPAALVLAGTRGIPVLSEAYVIATGARAGGLRRPMAVCAAANGAVAGCYTLAGHVSVGGNARVGGVALAAVVVPVVFVALLGLTHHIAQRFVGGRTAP